MVECFPKGEMCLTCVFKNQDCSGLDFKNMKVIQKMKEYNIVSCSAHIKEEVVTMDAGERYTLNDYQGDAMQFRLATATPEYAKLGLLGEAGEVASLEAKAIRDGKKMDYEQQMKKELGDVLWFVAAIAMDNGFTLQDVADANINKLNGRKEAGTIAGSGDNR